MITLSDSGRFYKFEVASMLVSELLENNAVSLATVNGLLKTDR